MWFRASLCRDGHVDSLRPRRPTSPYLRSPSGNSPDPFQHNPVHRSRPPTSVASQSTQTPCPVSACPRQPCSAETLDTIRNPRSLQQKLALLSLRRPTLSSSPYSLFVALLLLFVALSSSSSPSPRRPSAAAPSPARVLLGCVAALLGRMQSQTDGRALQAGSGSCRREATSAGAKRQLRATAAAAIEHCRQVGWFSLAGNYR